MFVFKQEQKTFDFGGVKIGGNPGENPTVLVGGLFVKGQPIVENTKEGLFDKRLAMSWIDTATAMSEKTGHPLIIQAYGRTGKAMEQHISWLSEKFDGPFMFESTNVSARKRGIEYCNELGLSDRAIYNSLNLSTNEEERELLMNSDINMAVVMGWSPKATSLPERMKTVNQMVAEAERLAIDKILVDPATMPVGTGYGLDYRTVLAIKSELGLPTCLAPHNASSAWKFLEQKELDDPVTYLSTVVASTVAAQLFACDCIMYGSMARSKEVFVSVALIGNAISTAIAEANQALGIDREIFSPPSLE
ncbi:MAG: hypothetical protein ACW97A_12565 [Candidatus Thorarchaeota archaeon]|jgi:tetrahydromethanopterin S-methyltransferase subunit H